MANWKDSDSWRNGDSDGNFGPNVSGLIVFFTFHPETFYKVRDFNGAFVSTSIPTTCRPRKVERETWSLICKLAILCPPQFGGRKEKLYTSYL